MRGEWSVVNNKTMFRVVASAAMVLTGLEAEAQTAGGASPSSATAAPTTSAGQGHELEEIVVTAQRRAENLQDVPIAITVATGAQLQAVGVKTTEDLAIVTPGLTVSLEAGALQPHIRGVGSSTAGPGLEQPVATYVDGVYIASPVSALFTLDNIDRIEVLKGPQGTLFGRNSTGGVIQLITKDPKFEPSGEANVSYGNYQDIAVAGYYTGGLTDKIAADVAVRYEHQGEGWGENIITHNPAGQLDLDLAVRSKVVFLVSDATSVRLALDYSERTTSTETQHLNDKLPSPFNTPALGGPFSSGGTYNSDLNVDEIIHLKTGGASVQVDQDLGFASLKSITAYRDTYDAFPLDIDYTPLPLLLLQSATLDSQVSQELQLSSASKSGYTWTTGLYYFHASDENEPLTVDFGPSFFSPVPNVPVGITVNDKQLTDSYAAYAQVSIPLPSESNLTLGGRYTHETKSVSGFQGFQVGGGPILSSPVPTPDVGIPDRLSFSRFNYRVALDHKFDDDILGYVSYNTGFKSGGFNIDVAGNAPYQPETISASEIGIKSELLDRRLRLNAAGFYYNYQNIQVSRFIEGNQSIYNGAKARIYGADLDFEVRATSDLSLNGGASYINSEFQSFPAADYFVSVPGCTPVQGLCSASAAGNRLPYAPLATVNVGPTYKAQFGGGTLTLNANYYWSAEFFAAPSNTTSQRPYSLISASATWKSADERYWVSLSGRNLGNTVYATFLGESSEGSFDILGAPRTYWVTVGVKY
jgi:iron complex outermembrane receptor protein